MTDYADLGKIGKAWVKLKNHRIFWRWYEFRSKVRRFYYEKIHSRLGGRDFYAFLNAYRKMDPWYKDDTYYSRFAIIDYPSMCLYFLENNKIKDKWHLRAMLGSLNYLHQPEYYKRGVDIALKYIQSNKNDFILEDAIDGLMSFYADGWGYGPWNPNRDFSYRLLDVYSTLYKLSITSKSRYIREEAKEKCAELVKSNYIAYWRDKKNGRVENP